MHRILPDTRLKRGLCGTRCMHQRLSSLHAEVVSARTGHMLQRCEQAIGMAALAGFVAYLTAGAAQLQTF